MLSGIGPKADLDAHRDPGVVLRPPGGGPLPPGSLRGRRSSPRSLSDFSILDEPDLQAARAGRGARPGAQAVGGGRTTGIYATNGAVLAIIRRSSPDKDDPDLFIFGLPASFKGYFPGYADALEEHAQPVHLGDPQGPHQEQGRHVTPPVDRPARPAEDQLPLLRRGDRRERRRPRRPWSKGVKFVRGFTKKLGVRPATRSSPRDGAARAGHRRRRAGRANGSSTRPGATTPAGPAGSGPSGRPEHAVLDTRLPGQGRRGPAGGGRLGLPEHPRLLHRDPDLHDRREGQRVILRDAGRPLPAVNWQPLPDDTWIPRSPK